MTPGLRIGKYEVGARLGKGSFGVVHLARDVELGREVAIKFLRPEFVEREQIVQRFLREARAAASIGHPGIITVFECGQVSGAGRADGTAYIVMERLHGDSLGDRIGAKKPFTYSTIVAIGRQLATALQAAHSAGIIHRDLKPDNVFLVPDAAVVGGERAKILDFGIAKLDDVGPGGVHTHSKMILGTPRYMSPEQARSSTNVDSRSDIYALGCMLYELICGRAPFEGDTGSILMNHQTSEVPPASSLIGNVPEPLDVLLRNMLQKLPDKRPPTMQAVDGALAAIKATDVLPSARSKAKFVEEVVTAVADPPRPKRISAAGELTARVKPPEDRPVETHQVEVDMYADVTDPEQPLMRRARSEPTPSEERTSPIEKLPSIEDASTERRLPPLRPVFEKRAPVEPTIQVRARTEQPTDPEARTDRDLLFAANRTLSTRPREVPRVVWFAVGGTVLLIALIALIASSGGGVPTPIDAAAVAPPDAPSVSRVDPKEARAWIESECKVARADRNWSALERCGRALVPHDERAGQTYVDLAKREAEIEPTFLAIVRLQATGDLEAAGTHLRTIPKDSMYRIPAEEAADKVRDVMIDRAITSLDLHAVAGECDRYLAELEALERRWGSEIRDVAAGRAMPCTPRRIDKKPEVDKKPGIVIREDPPKTPCADREALDAVEAKASEAFSAGSFAQSLALYESLLKCRPARVRAAYVAACRARNFARAKLLFSQLGGVDSLAQICLKEGYDPRS